MVERMLSVLQQSAEPSVRYLLKKEFFGCSPASGEMKCLQEEVRDSPRVQAMLATRGDDGKLPYHAYFKWKGAFWTLLQLVDLGYPAGDESLLPLREQVYHWLLDADRLKKIPLINGRWRRCALQESGAVYALVKLGLADQHIEQLVDLLLKWQWPDGGWNCDKKPAAAHSSFHESLIPLRGLNAYAQVSGDRRTKAAVARTAEMFLEHRLFKHLNGGPAILNVFTQLAYPPYWHYDILTALLAMSEVGCLGDPRCAEALDLLESKRLPEGGFAAETKYYRVTTHESSGVSAVGWGPAKPGKKNEWITVHALGVLRQAGRLSLPQEDAVVEA